MSFKFLRQAKPKHSGRHNFTSMIGCRGHFDRSRDWRFPCALRNETTLREAVPARFLELPRRANRGSPRPTGKLRGSASAIIITTAIAPSVLVRPMSEDGHARGLERTRRRDRLASFGVPMRCSSARPYVGQGCSLARFSGLRGLLPARFLLAALRAPVRHSGRNPPRS